MSSTNIFGGRRWCTLSIHGRAKSARGGEALRSAQPLGLEPPNLASRGGPPKLAAEGPEWGMNSYPRRKGEWPLQVSIAVLWPHASTAGRFFKVRPLRFFVSGSVQPQFRNMARLLLQLTALDLFDDVDEALVGAARRCRPARLRARQSRSGIRSQCAGPSSCPGPSTAADRASRARPATAAAGHRF